MITTVISARPRAVTIVELLPCISPSPRGERWHCDEGARVEGGEGGSHVVVLHSLQGALKLRGPPNQPGPEGEG
eukprot:9124893-Pyramimonas_sp.AAC.1